ncbi:MAG: hypothetical protein K5681_05895 [Treponema sp.]|nr:hypothetical protein [Treponema sp.]
MCSPKKSFSFIALILLFSIFAAISFESFHAGHEEHCHEEDCAICLVLQILHNTNKLFSDAVLASVEFFHSYYISLIIVSALLLAPATLVSQKIKLVI